MIQRPQSVFLLIVMLSVLVVLSKPIWIQKLGDTLWTLDAWRLQVCNTTQAQEIQHLWPYAGIALGTLVVGFNSVYALLRYDNRKLQIKLVAGSSLLMTCVLAVVLYFIACKRSPLAVQEHGIGLYALWIGVLANTMASRCIRRDDRRVRSADRVR